MSSDHKSGIQIEQPRKHCRNGVERNEKIDYRKLDPINMTLINNKENIDDPVGPEPTVGKPSTDILQSDDSELQPTADTTKKGFLDNILGSSDDDTLKAFNLYRKKKLLTQSMMDIALFSANASQLRNSLETNNGNPISYVCIGLLIFSILLQIAVGMLILLSIQYNVTNCEERKMAFTFNNYVIVGIFLITVVNIFITAFGGSG